MSKQDEDPFAPPPDQPPHGPPPAYGAPPSYGQSPPDYGYAPYGTPTERTGLPPGVLPGGLGNRLLARIVDALILLPVVVVELVVEANTDSRAAALAASLLVSLVSAAYEIVLISRRGATVGKKALGLKVVVLADSRVPGQATAIRRYALFFVSDVLLNATAFLLLFALVLALSPLFDNSGRRQGWWDKLAGTVVLKA